MAALNMYPLLVILLLASTSRMIFTTFAIPTFETSNSKILDECTKHISINCAREVGESIFEGGTVTDDCCHKLVSVGKNCHALFFNSALASIPNVDKSRALAKSTQVWNRCVGIALSPASSITIPNSKTSKSKIVDECKKHISTKCAREVGGSIFESGSVTYGCCYELVSAGKTCHDLFFNSVLASKPIVDKSRALVESTQVWDQCVEITISPAPSIAIPTPKALNSETLVECKHISINCAWEVGGSIFEGGMVTGDCCDDLLFEGKNMP
ncbi:hypothetical protein PRUPE_2G086800 [Prunus persica]|uniref:Prolamin-like domain-containing protein n=1 Tax=Prunus persica TaxID=3760 RepID=A0A251QDA2_PRUPE|nr:hypothetical protein PRUPE_2G086800 [Prunus persica]